MRPALKPLSEQVIVITGASSGIGLATARAAARAGAKVMLAARNEAVLRETEQAILKSGGMASYAVTDVTRREDIEALANTTVEAYGKFDTWVNDAGLGIFGKLTEISEEDHRQLFDTNFWGLVKGSLVAAEHLKCFGGGAIINLGSVVSDIGFPIQGMYSASKHAVKGFTDAFRMELMAENAPISVTLIKPTSINTPYRASNGGQTAGDSEHLVMRSAYTKAALHPALTGALAATAVVAAARLLNRSNRS